MNKKIEKETLVEYFHSLKEWTSNDAMTDSNWKQYIKVAKVVQQTNSKNVENSINEFMSQAIKLDENYTGFENESKVFLLLRIVFDLPESFLAKNYYSYKAWSNWPETDANGFINLAWPISWQNKFPILIDSYTGSMGQVYAASSEYKYFLEKFNFRNL